MKVFAAASNKYRQQANDVDLHRLQKTLAGVARDAPVGQQIEVRTLRLDEGQPHLRATFHTRHLNTGPKARAGRSRSEGLQYCILTLERGTQSYHSDQGRMRRDSAAILRRAAQTDGSVAIGPFHVSAPCGNRRQRAANLIRPPVGDRSLR